QESTIQAPLLLQMVHEMARACRDRLTDAPAYGAQLSERSSLPLDLFLQPRGELRQVRQVQEQQRAEALPPTCSDAVDRAYAAPRHSLAAHSVDQTLFGQLPDGVVERAYVHI